MKPKLRKRLGSVNSPHAVSLMRLIETQSKKTLANWCIGYAERNILPIFEKYCPGEAGPRHAISLANDWLCGKKKWPEVKRIVSLEARAGRTDNHPAAVAAESAIGQAVFTIHVPMHSLRFVFYAAAAVAYDRVGLNKSAETYDKIAEECIRDYEATLRAVAVENEPNPAKVNWKHWLWL